MPKLNSERAELAAQTETSSYEPIPEGMYLAKLREVTSHEGRTAPYWRWEYEIMDQPYVGRRMWDNTSLSDRALWRLKLVFEAFGVPTDTDTDELVAKMVALNIGTEVQEQGAGAGQLRNVVRDVLAARSVNQTVGKVAPAQDAGF